MDQDTIQKIAAEIAKHLPTVSWVPLLVQTAVTAAAVVAATFFGEYFRTRGKNLATKADFDSLKDQLRANTELVETIKSDVGQRDWAKREWANLRRSKLEQLLEQVNGCDHYRDLLRSKALSGESIDGQDPISVVEMLTILYFPELAAQAQTYIQLHQAFVVSTTQLVFDMMRAGVNFDERGRLGSVFLSTLHQKSTELLLAADTIKRAARGVLVEIAGPSVTTSDTKV